VLVSFPEADTLDLLHGLLLENVNIPSPTAAVDAYFANPAALELMPVMIPLLQ
jgi:hypothetical protein